jgi:hypothetical protein
MQTNTKIDNLNRKERTKMKGVKRIEFIVDTNDFEGMQIEMLLKNEKNKSAYIRNAILFYAENKYKEQQKNNLESLLEDLLDKKLTAMTKDIKKSLSNVTVVSSVDDAVDKKVDTNFEEMVSEENIEVKGQTVSNEEMDDLLDSLDMFG